MTPEEVERLKQVLFEAGHAYEALRIDHARLREQVRVLREALERITRMESAIVGLRPEFYGHGRQIALDALARTEPQS